MFIVSSFQHQYIDNLIQFPHKIYLNLKNGSQFIGKLISHDKEVVFFRDGVTQRIQKAKINTLSRLN